MYASVWSLRSDRYHYKLQESAKMCAPVLKPAPPTSNYFRRPWAQLCLFFPSDCSLATLQARPMLSCGVRPSAVCHVRVLCRNE